MLNSGRRLKARHVPILAVVLVAITAGVALTGSAGAQGNFTVTPGSFAARFYTTLSPLSETSSGEDARNVLPTHVDIQCYVPQDPANPSNGYYGGCPRFEGSIKITVDAASKRRMKLSSPVIANQQTPADYTSFQLIGSNKVRSQLGAAYKRWLKQHPSSSGPTVETTVTVTETSPGSFTASKRVPMVIAPERVAPSRPHPACVSAGSLPPCH